MPNTNEYIINFKDLRLSDLEKVGGKNASLGELIGHLSAAGVAVPPGFATTATAYWDYLKHNHLGERVNAILNTINVDDVIELAQKGAQVRALMLETPLQETLCDAISAHYEKLCAEMGKNVSVAVRSSATAEDLPDASFAGQQETLLNIQGIDAILVAVREVYASLFTDRAIAYRVHNGFAHEQVALSVGIQCMVRSDLAASGVMFTLDTESGFDQVVFITSSYGLGETIVQGAVNPDEFYVYKPALKAHKKAIIRRGLGGKAIKMEYQPDTKIKDRVLTVKVPEVLQRQFSITDEEVLALARDAMLIEAHYGRPMDIEWAKDGETGKLYILQARPETVRSRAQQSHIERYTLLEKGTVLSKGRSIGQKIGSGVAKIITSISQMSHVQPGDVLITDMTDPDWEPIMKRASAIVTNRGGRTCHAAIIAREMGIPAVVGTQDATQQIKDGDWVTVSCAEGDTGFVYANKLEFEKRIINVDNMPVLPFKIMMNIANPERAFSFQSIPNAGVGLARLEFIINRSIGIHPRALLNYKGIAPEIRAQIEPLIAAYDSPVDFYVRRLAEGIATLAAAFYPKPIIVRLSDFKSNEYANLLGGREYEPHEENPMIGFRGAARYISPEFQACFELECQALKIVRNQMGLDNVQVMVPFVRTLEEASGVTELLAQQGLVRGENGLKLIMMCEVPSNAILADEFLKYFDGFSIGSNDLTQLTLGLDRDSALVAGGFDERNPAIKVLLRQAIQACKRAGKYIGICGQGPSDHADFAFWLMEEGIDTISLNPDTVVETWTYLADELAKKK